MVELTKIEQSKITGNFVSFADESFDREGAGQEKHCAQIYSSVQEEARHDIAAARKAAVSKKNEASEPDIEALVANKRKQT